MKRRILSTGFGLVLAVSLFLPLSPAFVNIDSPSVVPVNVNGGDCIKIVGGAKINTCNMVQPQDVSWNSGGG
jgi:hypothetical protein